MRRCLLTYEVDGVTKETYLFYKKEVKEALTKFFLFNDKKKVKVISLLMEDDYSDSVEGKVLLPEDEVLKDILKNI